MRAGAGRPEAGAEAVCVRRAPIDARERFLLDPATSHAALPVAGIVRIRY